MSQAQEDVSDAMSKIADAFAARGRKATSTQVLKGAAPELVVLILERLDSIATEIRHANNKGGA
jgi:hypothetical protein